MRIACIYLPSLPLQALVRRSPQWIGAPVAIVSPATRGSSPSVVACSRAAWALGVRPGMTGLAAREVAPALVTFMRAGGEAASAERDALRALGDALLAVAARVDLGGEPSGAHHAVYAEVPARIRGATFGARLAEVVEAQGLRARVGIADDRFTAWVAASTADEGNHVVSVPRGGSAAFLAPMPLSLLAIAPEVQHMLAAFGVRTLGEFAALPPPSPLVTTTWDVDYQALARGDGGAALHAYVPGADRGGAIVERVDAGGEITFGAALERAAQRVAVRLEGRGVLAAQVRVRHGDAPGDQVDVPLAAPVGDAGDLADAVGRALHEGGASRFVEIEVPVVVPRRGLAPEPRVDAIPVTVPEEASGPIAAAGEPPVFRLVSPGAELVSIAAAAREPHRRTRRGKDRTRAAVAAQSRLFR